MRSLILSIFLLLITASVQVAQGYEVAPSLATGRVARDGWVALKFATTTDTELVLERHLSPTFGRSYDFSAGGYILYFERNGETVVSLTAFTTHADEGNIRVVQGGASSDPLLPLGLNDLSIVTLPFEDDVHLGVRGGYVLTVLFWEAGDIAEWTYVLRASNATLLGKTEGPGAYAFTAEDFEGLTVAASATDLGAEIANNGRVTIGVQNRLVGASYDHNDAGLTSMSIRLPSGQTHGFGWVPGPIGYAPGQYDLLLNGVGLHMGSEGRYVTVADMLLPE